LGKFISILKSIHLKYEINMLLLNFNTLKYQDLLFFFFVGLNIKFIVNPINNKPAKMEACQVSQGCCIFAYS